MDAQQFRELSAINKSITSNCWDNRILWESCLKYSKGPFDCITLEEKWVNCAASTFDPDSADRYFKCRSDVATFKRSLDSTLHTCPKEYEEMRDKVLKFYTHFNSASMSPEEIPRLN